EGCRPAEPEWPTARSRRGWRESLGDLVGSHFNMRCFLVREKSLEELRGSDRCHRAAECCHDGGRDDGGWILRAGSSQHSNDGCRDELNSGGVQGHEGHHGIGGGFLLRVQLLQLFHGL